MYVYHYWYVRLHRLNSLISKAISEKHELPRLSKLRLCFSLLLVETLFKNIQIHFSSKNGCRFGGKSGPPYFPTKIHLTFPDSLVLEFEKKPGE